MRNNDNFLNTSKSLTYIRNLYANEDILLKNVRNQCLLNDRPITINPEEGKLIQTLIKLGNIKNILEIGTLYGYSTIWFVRGIENNGKIITIEKEPENAKIARENFNKLENNLSNNIEIINGDANEELEKLVQKQLVFDMIFIDADKSSYPNYLNFTDKLLKKYGLIVADNTFLSGAVYNDYLADRIRFKAQKNMRLFNKMLADKTKYQSIMLNTDEGLNIAIKLI